MKLELESNEFELIGNWIFLDNKVIEDETAKRIKYLKDNYLIKIATSDSGWETLYQDPNDKRYWELIYAESDYQGGGAPILMNISIELVAEKYNI